MLGRRSERGATVVEAAFVLPILMVCIFGLVDLGMWTFNSNQATNAAKDGARIGIVQHRVACDKDGDGVVDDGDGVDEAHEWCGVDEAYSIAWNRAIGRIEAKLDRDLDATNVTITCESPAGATKACWSATVDVDRVRVAVDWTWDLLTPVSSVVGVDEGAATGVATMTIVGKPVGTPRAVPTPTASPPPSPSPDPVPITDCVVSNVKSGNPVDSNGSVKIKSNGQLLEDIYVTFTTNGADRCSGLAVQLTAPNGTLRSATCLTDTTCSGTDQHWVFDDWNDKIWSVGVGEARIYNEWVPGVTHNFNLQT